MRSIKVVELDPSDASLDSLVAKSHQTSLYVTRDWRLAQPSKLILGAMSEDQLVAAAFVEESLTAIPFVGYRGILQTKREQVEAVTALLQVALKVKPACLWNAPALVDVRPAYWMFPQALWRTDIRYTLFLDGRCRPFRELEAVEVEDGEGSECHIPWATQEIADTFERLRILPSTLTFHSGPATLIVGVDSQDRGYVIAGWGPGLDALTWSVAPRFASLDLGGANSPTMASKKRNLGAHLRTSYKLFNV